MDGPTNTTSGTTSNPSNPPSCCVICHEDVAADIATLGCGHVFHGHCVAQWFWHQRHVACPMCRAEPARKRRRRDHPSASVDLDDAAAATGSALSTSPFQIAPPSQHGDDAFSSTSSESSTSTLFLTPRSAHRVVWRSLRPLSKTQPRLVARYRQTWAGLKAQRSKLHKFRKTAQGNFAELRREETALERRLDTLEERQLRLAMELMGQNTW
jgi:hypothetical protein